MVVESFAFVVTAPARPAPPAEALADLAARTMPRLDVVSREDVIRQQRFAKAPSVLDSPAAAENVWKPRALANLANALVVEFSGQNYDGRTWSRDVSSRFAAVECAGYVRPAAMAVSDGGIEPLSLDAAPLDHAVPFLREMLRAIVREARAGAGEGASVRGFRAAVTRL
ncbi:MAG: hypothetical protein FJ034_00575 [Chloroflexi bacterium]|nr:hypothetical protein [Chloroflexota bacterium]